MTIDEMRDKMREKVVPEEVVPQNIINCLIDEDAEPPKLDAFTFLTRLRALGIGSADFLNLLEGCGAPESVVEKIRQNPAMNLQGLILTLDNSELTSEDYTRMMLVARQVWERTLTMRLEKSEKISREIEQEPEKYAEEPQDISDDYSEETTDSNENAVIEEYDDYDEDLQEMSFTAVFDKISTEMNEDVSKKGINEVIDAEHFPKNDSVSNGDSNDNETETVDFSFAEAFDKIKKEKAEKAAAVSDNIEPEELEETAENEIDDNSANDESDYDDVDNDFSLIQFDEEDLRRKFEELSDGTLKSVDTPEPEITEEPKKVHKEKGVTARQKKPKPVEEIETAEEISENEQDTNTEEENVDFDENDENSETSENNTHGGYFKGAIIGSAIGAAVLVGASLLIGKFFTKNTQTFKYAEDNSEIFNKIYYAYSDGITGGETVNGIDADNYTIFGDLLIGGESENKSLGSFNVGNGYYSVTEEAISANIIENGSATPLDDLIPPENTKFVAAFDDNGKLYALFSGQQSGYMKIADGKTEYTVRQDGVMTDYTLSNGNIKLGTVYTPSFSHTFSINDEDVYLPKVGINDPKPISAQKVVISNTNGYSYGVSAEYSTANGDVKNACAVIGDPVAASADGRFAVNGSKGLIVDTSGEKLNVQTTDKLACVSFSGNGFAIIEETNSEKSVKLYDKNFELKSILTGIPDKIGGMWFDGNVLSIDGKEGGVLRIDCADLKKPEPLTLNHENGVVVGNSALTYTIKDNTITIARFDLNNGSAEKVSEFSKELENAQSESIKFGDPRAVVIDGQRSGAAFSYFDGVSVISEYVVFENGKDPIFATVFDDKTGFTAAFTNNGEINAVCADGIKKP